MEKTNRVRLVDALRMMAQDLNALKVPVKEKEIWMTIANTIDGLEACCEALERTEKSLKEESTIAEETRPIIEGEGKSE